MIPANGESTIEQFAGAVTLLAHTRGWIGREPCAERKRSVPPEVRRRCSGRPGVSTGAVTRVRRVLERREEEGVSDERGTTSSDVERLARRLELLETCVPDLAGRVEFGPEMDALVQRRARRTNERQASLEARRAGLFGGVAAESPRLDPVDRMARLDQLDWCGR